MRLTHCAVLLALSCSPALGADANRIIALEQDVRNLERVVGNLEREIRELRRSGDRTGQRTQGSSPTRTSSSDLQWVDASKWKQVQRSMSELEVIELLGPPNTMRMEGAFRVLLYAMELGSTGFLSGSVRLRDGEVVEVQTPSLK